MSFKEIKGQARAIRRLQGLLKTGRVPPGLLFTGPEGIGKKLAALEFSKALGCEAGGYDACGECARCVSIGKGVSADVRVVDAVYQAHLLEKEADLEKDADKALAKQREWRVETIREICHEMQRRSFGGGWKAAIVDEAERMNVEAQNSLLKMLEEPPDKTLWILVSSQPGKLLPTIRSRTQTIAFGPLPPEVLTALLDDQGVPQSAELASSGSVRWALREREGREAFGELEGPLAPFEASDSLPKELASARPRVELALDYLASRLRRDWPNDPARVAGRMRELSRLRRWLRQNASPSLILELALAKTS
jgi:DNA polymerase III delta' subunit